MHEEEPHDEGATHPGRPIHGPPRLPYEPHYVEVADGDGGRLRIHYLDEGSRTAPVVLLMHGEPSWCFLYRKMIPVLVDAGLRCKAGARQFPMLVPISPDDPASAANRSAWETLRAFTKPFLTAFSDHDAITRGGDTVFQREVPGCKGQPHTTIAGGGHFLQEDKGAELARVVADWVAGG